MKHRFDKKRVVYSTAYLSVTTVLLQIAIWLRAPASGSEAVRYLQQMIYVSAAVFGVITVASLRKLIPKTLRRAVLDKLLEVARKAVSVVRTVSRRVLRVFGVNTARYKKRKDEKSFIFDIEELGIVKKLRSIKGSVKYKDLTDNSDKIRFIYVKYMVKLIKGGYKLPPSQTPNETKIDLKLENDDERLVELYNGARYSGGSAVISDGDVNMALGLISGK